MDLQLKIQYTLVAVIVLGALVWISVKVWRTCRRKNESVSGCCGCAIADKCKKPAKDLGNPSKSK